MAPLTQTASGALVSMTVTVALQVLLLPEGSLTVRTTVLVPTLAQVKVVGVALRELTAQLSVEPASTLAAVMLAMPRGLRKTVMFWQMVLGSVVSATVTVALQVPVLPLASVTESVTVLAPKLAQVNVVLLRLVLATAQLSVEPLLISLVANVALPVALR